MTANNSFLHYLDAKKHSVTNTSPDDFNKFDLEEEDDLQEFFEDSGIDDLTHNREFD